MSDAPEPVESVLVPVDGSDEATTAAEYAVSIADRYDATLQLLYVLDERVIRAIESGSVAADTVAGDHRAYLEELESMADDQGVAAESMIAYGFSTTNKRQHPGSVVLDSAEDTGADFLVIPRQPQGEDRADVLAKTAEYVLLYASQPVLSV